MLRERIVRYGALEAEYLLLSIPLCIESETDQLMMHNTLYELDVITNHVHNSLAYVLAFLCFIIPVRIASARVTD